MPTVPIEGPYRFFFYAADCEERPHVHVQREHRKAKFWLTPIEVAVTGGFKPHEVRQIERIIAENRERLLARWREVCKES
jgi:hypothetical protein